MPRNPLRMPLRRLLLRQRSSSLPAGVTPKAAAAERRRRRTAMQAARDSVADTPGGCAFEVAGRRYFSVIDGPFPEY
jgi:hypothetical protein